MSSNGDCIMDSILSYKQLKFWINHNRMIGTIRPPFCNLLVKPGARGQRPCAPSFLKLLWLVRQYVCVCVSPPPRPLITSHVKGTRNNRIMKFYGYSVSLYDTAINKLNRRGLSNTAGCEHLPK